MSAHIDDVKLWAQIDHDMYQLVTVRLDVIFEKEDDGSVSLKPDLKKFFQDASAAMADIAENEDEYLS